MTMRSFSLRSFPLLRGNVQIDVTPISGKIPMVSFHHASTQRFFQKTSKGIKASQLPAHLKNVCGYCGVFHEIAARRALDSLTPSSALHSPDESDNPLLRRATIIHHAQRVYTAYLPIKRGMNGLLDFHGNDKKHAENYIRIMSLGKKSVWGKTAEKEIETAKAGVHEVIEILSNGSNPTHFSPKNQLALMYHPAHPFTGDMQHLEGGKVKQVNEKGVQKGVGNFFRQDHQGDHSPLVGPLARFSINGHAWSGATKNLVKTFLPKESKISFLDAPLIRAIELWQHLDEWENQSSAPADEKNALTTEVKAGEGFGWVESPDGPIGYRVEVNGKKTIQSLEAFFPHHQNEHWMRAAIQEEAERSQPKTESEWIKCISPTLYAFDPCPHCMGDFL